MSKRAERSAARAGAARAAGRASAPSPRVDGSVAAGRASKAARLRRTARRVTGEIQRSSQDEADGEGAVATPTSAEVAVSTSRAARAAKARLSAISSAAYRAEGSVSVARASRASSGSLTGRPRVPSVEGAPDAARRDRRAAVRLARSKTVSAVSRDGHAPAIGLRGLGRRLRDHFASLPSVGLVPVARRAAAVLLSLVLACSFSTLGFAGLAAVALIPAMSTTDSAGTGSLSGTMATIAAYLKGKGLSDVAVAGIIGNMCAETTMSFSVDPTCAEAGGTGIGIVQFSFGEADALRAFAAARGTDWTDLGTQLDFFWDQSWGQQWITQSASGWTSGEFTYECGRDALESETDVDRAAVEFMVGYERPGQSPSTNHFRDRQRFAEQALAALRATATGSLSTVVSAAQAYMGVPYLLHGTPSSSHDPTDCSGLTMWCYEQIGIDLPHNSTRQLALVSAEGSGWSEVTVDTAVPGDLVLRPGHAAIYAGDGRVYEEWDMKHLSDSAEHDLSWSFSSGYRIFHYNG